MEQHIFGTPRPAKDSGFTGVLQCSCHPDDGSTCASRVPCGEPVLVLCELPLGRVTIYDAVVADDEDILILVKVDQTWWCASMFDAKVLSNQILDLCAGCGGMGVGTSFLGGNVKVAVDHNKLATDHLRANFHGTVMEHDMMDLGLAKKIHQIFEESPGTMTMGFPCQPWSSQGAGKGVMDDRFQTFYAGLRIMFLVQGQSAILECVPNAGQCPQIQAGLQALAEAMHWDILQIELDLQDRWASRRRRWWALLLPSSKNSHGLQAWQVQDTYAKVGSLFTQWGSWAHAEENDLQLFSFEMEAYLNPMFGNDKRILNFNDTAATMLHSYGNALLQCPCQCRLQPLSVNNLRTKGLRGFFVPSQVHGNARYLHHQEAALLLGIPQTMNFVHSPRGNLALIGLVASPIQMVWLYGSLLSNWRASLGQSFPDPEHCLQAFQHELLRQTEDLFRNPLGALSHIEISDAEGKNFSIASATSCSVGQLLGAQRICLNWNEAGGVTRDGLHLPLPQLLDFTAGPYLLSSEDGMPNRPRPTGMLMIALVHQQQLEVHFLTAGQFIFEILRPLDLHDINFLVDDDGKVYGADFRVWKSMRLTTLPNWPPQCHSPLRGAGLCHNLPGLSDGQVWAALKSIMDSIHPDQRPLLIHPKDAHTLLTGQWDIGLLDLVPRYQERLCDICCVFPAQNHWALLWGERCANEINWIYLDGLSDHLLDSAGILAGKLNHLFGIQEWSIALSHSLQQSHPHTCGTIALLHVGLCLGLFGIPCDQDVLALHNWLLTLRATVSFTGHGLSAAQVEELEYLLKTHGVPTSAVSERAKQVITKLGPSAIQDALGAKNKWGYLKALANKPSVSLRLVHADELTKHIDNTAAQKFGAAVPNKNKKKLDKKPAAMHINVDPAMLALTPGSFLDSEDDTVAQIDFASIEAEATGIAVSSLTQGLSWLRTKASISTMALALLVTEVPPAEVMQEFGIEPLTFTATYRGTGEPMIIYGAMKNLGDLSVRRVIKGTKNPELVTTQVVKILIYRDELEGDWGAVAAAPVKALCQRIPQLQLCKGVDCGSSCEKTHCPVDESFDTVLMEVWSRTFATLQGAKQPAETAQLFWVFVRVPQSLVGALLQIQCPGIYFEPRQDGHGHDDRYRVIWLPARSYEEAIHSCKSCVHALGLVRIKMKYGVRVKSDHEETTFKFLKPDSTFVDTQVQRVFQFFPLPHGLQRAGVQKLLEGIKWTAKPLQPGRSSAQALSWQVGASEGPPVNVFTAFDEEVIITELTKEQKPKPPVRFVASDRTQKHLRSEASSSSSSSAVDPWLQKESDPWFNYNKTTATATGSTGKKHLQEVTGLIREELTSSLQKELETFKNQQPMATDDPQLQKSMEANEKRFHRLETSMGEMKAQNQQFSQWFNSMGQQLQGAEAAIQTINYTLSTHQAELTGLQTEVKNVPDQIGSKLNAALAQHKDYISEDFDKRFSRLEALFEKRHKTGE